MELVSNDKKIRLTPIKIDDIENLRIWKNIYKDFFFLKKEINKKDQKSWFENIYLKNKNDFMFIIYYKSQTIGTIGCRLINNYWDIYNVMNVNKDYKGKGIMSLALKLLISFMESKSNKDVTAKVLANNSNLKWYLKNNFNVVKEMGNYNFIKYFK